MITRTITLISHCLAKLTLASVNRMHDAEISNNDFQRIEILEEKQQEEKTESYTQNPTNGLPTRFHTLTAATIHERNKLAYIESIQHHRSAHSKAFLNLALLAELVGIGLCVSSVLQMSLLNPGLYTVGISVWLDLVIGLCNYDRNTRDIISYVEENKDDVSIDPNIERGFVYHALRNNITEKISHIQLQLKNDALIAAKFRLFAVDVKLPTSVQNIILEYADLTNANTRDRAR